MDSKQFATYLANLRENRVNRPGGSRSPTPASTRRQSSERPSPGRPSIGGASVRSEAAPPPSRSETPRHDKPRSSAARSIVRPHSTMASRDYYPEKATSAAPLRPNEVVPTAAYMERGTRWMEKEEAVSLRAALEEMDLKDHRESDTEKGKEPAQEPVQEDEEETRIYNAALDEAAELVWRHEHGIKDPEPGAPYRYKPHMRRNSYAHARAASAGRYGDDIVASGLGRDVAPRSVSGSSAGSDGRSSSCGESSMGTPPRPSMDGPSTTSIETTSSKSHGSSGKRGSSGGANRRSSMKRNISGEVQRPFSGDQIWEEPEATDTPKPSRPTPQPPSPEMTVQPLRLKHRSSPNRVQFAPESTSTADDKASPTTPSAKPSHRVEIHRNPPSQSRNPNYTSNSPKPAGPRANDKGSPKKNGIEVRGDDIRQATSFRLSERSGKLPTPSAVSDSPGRPISPKRSPDGSPAASPSASDREDNDNNQPSASRTPNHKPRPSVLSQLRRVFGYRRRQRHSQQLARRPSQVLRSTLPMTVDLR